MGPRPGRRADVQRMGFPEAIAEAIASHHGSDDPDVRQLPPVNLSALIGEVDEERGVEELVERAHATMGLDHDQVRTLVDDCFRCAEEIAEQFA